MSAPKPPLLSVRRLSKHYPLRGGRVLKALDDVSFDVAEGEIVGLVGESGSGKSTLGRLILRLLDPTAGQVLFRGEDVFAKSPRELRQWRREAQIVFQDPGSALDPRRTVFQSVTEGLFHLNITDRSEKRRRAAELLELVGLPESFLDRYPHELSGGQRQRVCIARALSVNPSLLVADEPVSALDVSVQAQILNLFADLYERLGLTLIFISHDLAVVNQFCTRVIVLYRGRIVEDAPQAAFYRRPYHPYSMLLMESVPVLQPGMEDREVEWPDDSDDPLGWEQGCAFANRCPFATERCRRETPRLVEMGGGRQVACFHPNVDSRMAAETRVDSEAS